jgi:RNA recognition motif-containing protein
MRYLKWTIFLASEVFVGGIPRDCMESELVPVLEKAGQIWQIRLMIASGGQNRGYCFVNYQKPEEAARACQILNNYEIRPGKLLSFAASRTLRLSWCFKDSYAFLTGCQIGVLKSADSHSMFLGGIPKDKTSAEVFDEIKNITAGVIEANVVPAYQSRDLNKGYAYVEYESHK